MGWLRMTSAPDRPEAALQFTLRKSAWKSVTAEKIFAPPADSRGPPHCRPRWRIFVAAAPGGWLPVGL